MSCSSSTGSPDFSNRYEVVLYAAPGLDWDRRDNDPPTYTTTTLPACTCSGKAWEEIMRLVVGLLRYLAGMGEYPEEAQRIVVGADKAPQPAEVRAIVKTLLWVLGEDD